MRLRQLPTGGDRNFGYLVTSAGEAAVVDPGDSLDALDGALRASGSRLRWLIGTHGHEDHVCGLEEFQRRHGGERVLSVHAPQAAERRLDGAELRLPLGDGELRLLATPGHTPCGLCVLLPEENDIPGELISGDLLFVGKIGGTPDEAASAVEHRSLHDIVLRLPDETGVWPGHDYGVAPRSTIGRERRSNPFLLQPDFAAFLDLKANWPAYKRKHGIA